MLLSKKKTLKTDDDVIDVPSLETNNKDLSEDVDFPNLDEEINGDITDDFGMTGAGDTPLSKHSDLLKELTNFDPYLKEMINNWLGLRWDQEKGEFTKDSYVKPVMTAQGAAWCLGVIKTYARNNNIITNISHEEYKNIMEDHIEAIWLNLGTRISDLGVIDDGDLLRVCNELEHAAALILMGAGDGKYNDFLGTSMTRHENINTNAGGNNLMGIGYQPAPQKAGMIEKFRQKIIGI